MKNKRNHKTTKNTVTKPPVTKIAKYTLDVNGVFTLVTDITDDKVFEQFGGDSDIGQKFVKTISEIQINVSGVEKE